MTELVRVTRGVWRERGDIDDLPGRCAALLTAMPAGSVVAGRTAARLHRLWLPAASDGEPVELILRRDEDVPRSLSGTIRREVRGRRRYLRPDDIDVVDGVPVTSLCRTWVDLAEQVRFEDLVAAGDCALRAGAQPECLASSIGRAAGRRGVLRARQAFPLIDSRSRSRPESHLRVGLVMHGLTPSGVNEPIWDEHGQWLAEPDLTFDEARLALEYNGAMHAGTNRMRRDITREIDLAARGGWRTITVGPAEVFQRMDQPRHWYASSCAADHARSRGDFGPPARVATSSSSGDP